MVLFVLRLNSSWSFTAKKPKADSQGLYKNQSHSQLTAFCHNFEWIEKRIIIRERPILPQGECSASTHWKTEEIINAKIARSSFPAHIHSRLYIRSQSQEATARKIKSQEKKISPSTVMGVHQKMFIFLYYKIFFQICSRLCWTTMLRLW